MGYRKQILFANKKDLKNVGSIRHCEPPHTACSTLPFTRCRYCNMPPLSHAACASMSTTTNKFSCPVIVVEHTVWGTNQFAAVAETLKNTCRHKSCLYRTNM